MQKYDYELEKECRGFLSELLGKPLEGDFLDILKSGELLCEALNKIKPGTVARINHSKFPFPQHENIKAYIDGCRSLGVQEYDLFTNVDLFEKKNPPMVLQNIFALGRAVQNLPGWTGPKLGPPPTTGSIDTSKAKPLPVTAEDIARRQGFVGAGEKQAHLDNNILTKTWDY